MNTNAPADRDDRIGAGGILASDLLADIAKQKQANVDRIMATLKDQQAHDSEELLEAERRRIVAFGATD